MQTMKRIRIDYEDMIRMDNLLAADIVVRQGKKYTRDMRKWDANWQTNFQLLYDDLINETYTPLPCRESVRMTDGGKVRNIKEAMHRDKIVAEMIVQTLDPIFTPTFINRTYGNIKGRGPLKCQHQVIKDLNKIENPYCLKIDIRKYYESVDPDVMMDVISRKIKGSRVLRLISVVMNSHGHLPIGGRHSQLFGNIYLSELDHYVVQVLGIKYYERYCDDVVIFDKDKKVLHTALRDIKEYLTTKRKLDIKPNWQVFPVDSRGVDFLGSVFYTYKIDLRTRTKHRHRAKLSRLNKKASDPLYEDRYMASLNGILKHRDTDNLIKIWRIKYERVFKRHEKRAAVRAAFNEHKRRVKALEAELQYYGDVSDRIRRREHESRNAV